MQKINIEILRMARESRLMTQGELADAIGIEQGTLSKIEKDIFPPEDGTIKKIASVLNYPLEFFF